MTSSAMKWSVTKIKQALGDKLIGNQVMKKSVCAALLLLPPETIAYVCEKVWFISSPEDSWAMSFHGSEIKNRSLIFLSDELLRQNANQIRHTILHEIGHVVLGHRNSIGIQQSDAEIERQEKEADGFAATYQPDSSP